LNSVPTIKKGDLVDDAVALARGEVYYGFGLVVKTLVDFRGESNFGTSAGVISDGDLCLGTDPDEEVIWHLVYFPKKGERLWVPEERLERLV
jgi:hypothetical protein